MFTIVNKSTLVSDEDVKTAVRAVAHQVRYHAVPVWGVRSLPVVFSTDESTAPPNSYVIGIVDTTDQQGALGWHTEGPGGVVYGIVAAKPILDNGGDALTKDLSVASVLSHEVLETLCDSAANLWADDGRGTLYAREVGDPVESDSYVIEIDGTKVTVSNFVLPAWFDPEAAKTARFDWMHKVKAPFQMSPGGYVVKMVEGKVSQQFGEKFPEWRKDIKSRPNAGRRPKG